MAANSEFCTSEPSPMRPKIQNHSAWGLEFFRDLGLLILGSDSALRIFLKQQLTIGLLFRKHTAILAVFTLKALNRIAQGKAPRRSRKAPPWEFGQWGWQL